MSPDFLDKGKEAMAKRMMGQITPSETPIAQAVATSLTTVEHRLAAAIDSAHEAAGTGERIRHDPDERKDSLLSLADAVAEQRVQDWWFENVGAYLLDNHERAKGYVGLSGDEWRGQLRRWYEQYHEAGVVDTPLDEADPAEIGTVADRHIRETFGISLREFVAAIVNWSRGEQLQGVMFGPIKQYTAQVRRLEEEIEQRDERIAELEEQIDGEA
ncbi:hypothetical protein SAMN05216388_1001237 [Halorientalis persicus]|uniref:Uncharacterized protein n=1 Tax=Halorientalis persicus TaxID=1367881 RepID=A0A1H8DDR1_9EURY|nr:hypothetical protein [Halorientalis persicus]SEN04607.1 hypothetical protein SAMN05216388_1001237 [Halorientalis persicus]